MIQSRRASIHKGAGARHFRGSVSRTHRKNIAPRPMRGGFRL